MRFILNVASNNNDILEHNFYNNICSLLIFVDSKDEENVSNKFIIFYLFYLFIINLH